MAVRPATTPLAAPRTRLTGGPSGALLPLLLVAAGWVGAPLSHAQDSVTVRAGAHYDIAPELRFLLGTQYRDLWNEPIRVPVLRPDTFAGGLTLLQRGGGMQTASLRFRGGDGREYVFRSADKDQEGGLPEDLRGTLVSRIAQDQVSSKHPAAGLVVAPILAAAGIPHPSPRMAVMQDHPLLGEHRAEFAGMLGTIEERPEDSDDGPGFGGYPRVIGSERLLERLEESSEDRPDARAYLRARLVDLLVGDWDRHPDQWRWGQEDRGGRRYWIAIPRDRDNALSDFDGLFGTLGRAVRPNVQGFGPEISNLYGLAHNAQPLDRRILPELPLPVWDSIAADLGARISDAVIDSAVANMPAEYVRLSGARLAATLRARRDALPAAARDFYHLLATEVDVRATDEDDLAEIAHQADGSVRLRLSTTEGEVPGPYLERTFSSAETRELRVHLHGGDDRVVVGGSGGRVMVRVVGGGGDDAFEDGSRPRGVRNLFYDDRGDNRVVYGPSTRFDPRPYEVASAESAAENNAPPPRDWGRSFSAMSPHAEWRSGIGPILGAGPEWTRYGFRRQPFATRARVALLVAPLYGRIGVEGELRRIHTGEAGASWLTGRATQLHITRFHGYGNETTRRSDGEQSRFWAVEYDLTARLARRVAGDLWLSAGPRASYLVPDVDDPEVARLRGGGAFGILGAVAGAELDRSTGAALPESGFRANLEISGFPLVAGNLEEGFARGEMETAAYLPLGGALEPILALRGTGAWASARAPFQHAAFLGGGGSLRGYGTQRFAGDAAVSASAELRTRLARANLLVARGEVGAITFVDAGRVFLRGESSDRLHTGFGAGLWFATLDRAIAAHALVGYGEQLTLHAGFGLPF